MILKGVYRVCLACIVCLVFNTLGQNGNLFITNYSPYKLGGSSDQNHDIIEDLSQRIFVANLNGVYYGDGKKWELIKLRNEASSYSLSRAKDGKIYVGGESEFGYIDKLRDGRFDYVSLSSRLKDQEKDFTTVWYTYALNNAVVFLSNERLFKYQNGKLISYLPKGSRFHTAFPVGEHLLVRDDGVGLKVLINDSLYLIDGTEVFAEARIYSILHDKGNEYFIFSRDAGIYKFIYNPLRPRSSLITKINSEFEGWMLGGSAEISCGLKISSNRFAFGSLMSGIVFTDENFKILKRLNSGNGLQDDMIKRLYLDGTGNIWASLNKGASLIEYNSPISYWGFDEGINGVVESVVKAGEKLYIGTDKGLKYLDTESNRFVDLPFDGITPWSLLNVKEKLFVSGDDGVYVYTNGKFEKVFSSESVCYTMQVDKNNPGLILIGNESDFIVLRNQVNSYFVHLVIKDLGKIRKIVSTRSGLIVAATNDAGLYLIDKHKNYKVIPIGIKEGLSTLLENEIFCIDDNIYVNSDKNAFLQVQYKNNQVSLKPFFKPSAFIKNSAVEKSQQVNNLIWIETVLDRNGIKSEEIALLEIKSDSLVKISSPLKRIREVTVKQFYHDSDRVFLATNNGLFAYDLNFNIQQSKLKTYVTYFGANKDSLGFFSNLEQEFKTDNIKIPWSKNNIVIKPGSSVYYGSENLEFSYYLEGRETNFSEWKDVNEISYDNLYNGDYVFHLRSKNVLGVIGDEIKIRFTILPPWYRTWWAYTVCNHSDCHNLFNCKA